jgi:protein-arginine kinase activator protein McsA
MKSKGKKINDISFLEERLKFLLKEEDYEKAAIIKRWIDELKQKSTNI